MGFQQKIYFILNEARAGQMIQQVRAHSALPEYLNLIFSIHSRWLKTTCDSSCRESRASDFLALIYTYTQRDACTHTHTHTPDRESMADQSIDNI